jgi:hypothetical protein
MTDTCFAKNYTFYAYTAQDWKTVRELYDRIDDAPYVAILYSRKE